jgi:hypothetical protein
MARIKDEVTQIIGRRIRGVVLKQAKEGSGPQLREEIERERALAVRERVAVYGDAVGMANDGPGEM